MIKIVHKRIENIQADAIVNASNGIGYMGGRLGRFIRLPGVAESLHYVTKGVVEKEAKQLLAQHPVREGDVFVTSGGVFRIPILHAVTMQRPGTRSELATIERCLQNLIQTVKQRGFDSVAIPYLGTGTGKLNKNDVHALFEQYLAGEDVCYIIADPKKTIRNEECS